MTGYYNPSIIRPKTVRDPDSVIVQFKASLEYILYIGFLLWVLLDQYLSRYSAQYPKVVECGNNVELCFF